MSEIPEKWTQTSLGEVVQLNPKSVLDDELKVGFSPMAMIPKDYRGVIEFEERLWGKAKKGYTHFQDGDVLFAKVTPCFENGKAAFVTGLPNGKGAGSTEYFVLRPYGALIESKYLLALVKTKDFLRNGATNMTGSVGLKRVPKEFVQTYPLPLPPLAEQKEIAARLDNLLAQVDSIKSRLDSIPTILKRFRQSVLAAAVSGRLTEEWRKELKTYPTQKVLIEFVKEERKAAWLVEQSRASERKGVAFSESKMVRKYKLSVDGFSDDLKLTQIDKVPDEWLISNLDSVSIAVTGKTPPTSDQSNWGGDLPFISPSQIESDGGIKKPERHVSITGAKRTPVLPEKSILIVCIGTIGKVGYLDRESAFNQQINALIPSGAIKSEFLFIWAKTLHSWLNKTSSAVVNAAIINKSRLCSAPCPVPSLEEQTEIVRRVEQLFTFADQVEQRVKEAQSRVNNLTQSILAKAFRGELTADWREQNPDLISGENSAEALLERIKAERETIQPKRKTKTKKSA